MTLSDLKKYWRTAAENHNDIAHDEAGEKHFCSYCLEDALTELRDIVSPAIALEYPEIHLFDSNSDNELAGVNTAILAIKKVEQGNYMEIEAAMEEMYVVGVDMISKLLNDRKKAFNGAVVAPEKYVQHLDLNRVKMVEVGPVFDGWYGWRIDHAFASGVNLDLDEDKWTGETKVTY